MNRELSDAIESSLADSLDEKVKIARSISVSGGCINNSMRLDIDSGKSFFAKFNSSAPPEMFLCEFAGLEAISQVDAIRSPRAIVNGICKSGETFLITEWIEPGAKSSDFEDKFGRQIAELHQKSQRVSTSESSETVSQRFGFDRDNFIGSTPQRNRWHESWPDFWRTCRIDFQLDLAVKNGFGDQLNPLRDRFVKRMDLMISAVDEQPSLLHGDLWSGNYFADSDGNPAIVDPAVYFGSREAEFGMIRLFGGVGKRFYESYADNFPFHDGFEERFEIYKLYHVLNHLNLFGSSYLSQCISIMKKFT